MSSSHNSTAPISFLLLAIIAVSTGCASTKKTQPPIKIELEKAGTKVYDRDQGGNQPPPNAIPSDTYGAEEYFSPNNGAQPVIRQPQVMIIGQTPQRDPNNPNVYRGGRVDYVVVRDWEWNETALRKGADIQIPDPTLNSGIEELTVVDASGVRLPPAPKQTAILSEATLSGELPTAVPTNSPTALPKDQMELPGKTAPAALEAFLKANGKAHYGLRKNLRTLGLPEKAQYDQASRMVGPDEELGWLPNYGWTAFQLKTANDLTEDEKERWTKSQDYLAFAADFQAKRQAQAKVERQLAEQNDLDGTRPTGGKVPFVIDVDLTQTAKDGSVTAEPRNQ